MTSAVPAFSLRNGATPIEIGKMRADPLPRLLRQLLARAGEQTRCVRVASRPWASALFQGRRHVVDVQLIGPDADVRADRFADGLSDAHWSLSGHFVADITIDARAHEGDSVRLTLSALTIEDW